MALQYKINGQQVAGIVGEFSDNSPKTARAYLVYGKGTGKPTFGTMFSFYTATVDAARSTTMTAAKQGTDADSAAMGILVNPKEHYVVGFKTARTCENGVTGTIATRGHIWVMAKTTVTAGSAVYVDANGDLGGSTLSSGTEVLGAKWLTSATLASGKTEVLAEIAIDNPSLKPADDGE